VAFMVDRLAQLQLVGRRQYNIRMIRYSDVVLMAAEAACEMGGEAMIEEALDYSSASSTWRSWWIALHNSNWLVVVTLGSTFVLVPRARARTCSR